MDKDKIISQVYNDPLGFGSNHSTLKDARKLDPSITLEDIQKWKQDNIERKKHNSKVTIHLLQVNHMKNIKLICFS